MNGTVGRYLDMICVGLLAVILAVCPIFAAMDTMPWTTPADTDPDSLSVTADDSAEAEVLFTENDRDDHWDTVRATRITLDGTGAQVKGTGVYVNGGEITILQKGSYVVSGALTEGSLRVNAGGKDKVRILLDGAYIHCETGAAFRVEQAGKVFLTLAENTENRFSSGTMFDREAVSAGIDGTVYSRDDLTINGSGTLSIAAPYCHGIVCNDDLVLTGGVISVDAARDGFHAHDNARFSNMDLTIRAGDDAISVSDGLGGGEFYMESGSITVTECYEGLEAIHITITGGKVTVYARDDGLNANGGRESVIQITGGEVNVFNSDGRDADGLDSNGSIFLDGGQLFVSLSGTGSNTALDYGMENGGVCEINGGTVIACGGSLMAEGISDSSRQCSVFYILPETVPGGTAVQLRDPYGAPLLSKTIPNSFSAVLFSTPELELNETYTVVFGSEETAVILREASGIYGGTRGGIDNYRPLSAQTSRRSTPPQIFPRNAQQIFPRNAYFSVRNLPAQTVRQNLPAPIFRRSVPAARKAGDVC